MKIANIHYMSLREKNPVWIPDTDGVLRPAKDMIREQKKTERNTEKKRQQQIAYILASMPQITAGIEAQGGGKRVLYFRKSSVRV